MAKQDWYQRQTYTFSPTHTFSPTQVFLFKGHPENQLNQFENLAPNGVRIPRFILVSGVQDLSWTSQTKVWTPENQLNQFENLAPKKKP